MTKLYRIIDVPFCLRRLRSRASLQNLQTLSELHPRSILFSVSILLFFTALEGADL